MAENGRELLIPKMKSCFIATKKDKWTWGTENKV